MTQWTNDVSHLLRVVLLLVSMPTSTWGVMTPINLYSQISPTHDGATWGKFCYDLTQYTPTCGWKVIFSMNYKVTQIEVWDSTAVKKDDYTYELTAKNYVQDLSTRSGACQNINIKGTFWNTNPAIAVTFSCVCTASSGGECQDVPHTLLPAWDAPATSSSESSTTPIPVTAAPMTTPLTTAPTQAVGSPVPVSNSNLTSIRLSQMDNNCYIGLSKQQLAITVYHLTDCGAFCLGEVTCEGINFHTVAQKCDLVSEAVSSTTWTLDPVIGCQFWKVLWKK